MESGTSLEHLDHSRNQICLASRTRLKISLFLSDFNSGKEIEGKHTHKIWRRNKLVIDAF